MIFLYILAFITLAVTFSQYYSFRRMYKYVDLEMSKPEPQYLPRLAVILPCKGLDPGFHDNMRKLLEQDYKLNGKANFEVIFAVAAESDPAYEALKSVMAEFPAVKTRLVVAGLNPRRAQKINNQIEALKHLSADTEAIAFVDSDVIARSDFLKFLISRLDEDGTGATTGYRFYVPYRGDAASMLRSIWNRMSAWEMASPKYCFAWGGAMAIRREIFEKARVLEHWDAAADDDLSLTTAVKDIGLRVRFVPQCLVASHGDGDWTEVIEWTNRQLILTKVYYPALWRRGIMRAGIMATWLLSVFSCLLLLLATGEAIYLHSLLTGLIVLPIEVYFLLKGQGLWLKVLSDRQDELRSSLWKFVMALPLAHLALPWMTLYSLCTNRIQWRGVTYELRSPSEIVVI
ncbi:MAG: glycosyltransferase family 2 protein [Candidatus Obscuribacterales bacterium]|nr:glycosyltransferase family 2 protein [Candidatus Obscuribacterales bacterium]